MKHLEIKTIEHDGVKVIVKIDYDAATASFVESKQQDQSGRANFVSKQWIFANRTLDYMNGWITILEAMKVAVRECKKDLEADLAEKSRFKERIVENVLKHDAMKAHKKSK